MSFTYNGSTTRYYDCCKPSCAWPNNAARSGAKGVVKTCTKGGTTHPDANVMSGCEGGDGYACANTAAWVDPDDPNLSWGFAAKNSYTEWQCGKCFELIFDGNEKDKMTGHMTWSNNLKVKGKRMIVQAINSGAKGEYKDDHFDIMMGGGGPGNFDACNRQFGSRDWGAQWGGYENHERAKCANLPKEQQASCYWRFDWADAFRNPSVTWRQVRCPQKLVNISGIVNDNGATVDPIYPNGAARPPVPTPPPAPKPAPSPPPGTPSLKWGCAQGSRIFIGCTIPMNPLGRPQAILNNGEAVVYMYHDQLVISHPRWDNDRNRVTGTPISGIGEGVSRLEVTMKGQLILWGTRGSRLWDIRRDAAGLFIISLEYATNPAFKNGKVAYPTLVVRKLQGNVIIYQTFPTESRLRY